MKYCAVLAGDPPGLAQFRANNPTETNWATFKDGGQHRYNELADALDARQRGICAFCESRLVTDIPTPARQIEHWIPKSNSGHPSHAVTFGVANLHASCLGGSKPHLAPPFGTQGLSGDNLSCGQKKGEVDPNGIALAIQPYRPTALPLSPPIFSIALDGTLGVNAAAVAAGLSSDRIDATINYFGLNCERLRVSRAKVRAYLDDKLADYAAEETDPDPMVAIRAAMRRLASDLSLHPGASAPAFITVLRDFFGPAFHSDLLPDPNWAVG